MGLFIKFIFIWLGWNFLGLVTTSFFTNEPFVETPIVEEDESMYKSNTSVQNINHSPGGSVHSGSVRSRTHSVVADELQNKLMLSWSDIHYIVPSGDSEKHILTDAFGYALPGQLIALMGPTGAGKSTLLDVLADRKTGGTITGNIKINNTLRNQLNCFQYIAGYVEQFDSHLETQTVKEAIEYSALLRLPCTYPNDVIQRRVAHTIESLEL
eukprot:UN31236